LFPGAVEALQKLKSKGWIIIIDTGRSDTESIKDFLDKHKVPYDFVNENPYEPDDVSDTKIVCDVKIDDRVVTFRDWSSAVDEIERRYWDLQILRRLSKLSGEKLIL